MSAPPRSTLGRRLQKAIGRRMLGLPDALVRRLAGPPIERDGRVLDPQVQLALRSQKAAGMRPAHVAGVHAARLAMAHDGTLLDPDPLPQIASRQEQAIAGRRALVYRPLIGADAPPPPALVYLHGGGHVLGSPESHAGVCQLLCAGLQAVVVAPDYRLAPEHPFPAAFDDAFAVFRAVVAEAAVLGVDPLRVAVGGDSAGGNLAAAVALQTREDVVRPRAQLLIYPVVDLTMSFPSVSALGRGFFLEQDTIAWFRAHYLAGQDPKDPRASPWHAPDLRGAAPAVVVTAGFDPLRDEGNAYADRLRAAGVEVSHREYGGLFHGFFNTSGVIRQSKAAVAETTALLAALLG
jgi:acetyl esterase